MSDEFVETVDRHFHFLESEFNFVKSSTKPPFVVFESDKLIVSVFYDENRGCELDLVIRRKNDSPQDRKSIDIGFLMLLKEGPNSENYRTYRVSYPFTNEALEIEVKRLAELLREYGTHILRGDLSDFERIEQIEKDEFARALREQRSRG